MTKSWWQERYPPHACPECDLEHVKIPGIQLVPPTGGEPVAMYPFEVIGEANGTIHPGAKLPGMDTPVKIVGLAWGMPGSTEVLFKSPLFMN